jgi:hypothetical protein
VNHFYVGAENSKAMQFQKFVVVFEQNMRHENCWYVSSVEGEDVWVQQSAL